MVAEKLHDNLRGEQVVGQEEAKNLVAKFLIIFISISLLRFGKNCGLQGNNSSQNILVPASSLNPEKPTY